MTDNQINSVAPDVASGSIEVAPVSVGTVLREARIQHGLSVDEISSRIKFAPRQIEALEADDFAHLPEAAFLRGFVRSYAHILQLDAAPLLAALPHAPELVMQPEAHPLTEVPFPDANSERKQNTIWLVAAIVVVIALVLAAWMFGDKPKMQTAPEATVSDAQNVTVETLPLPPQVPVSMVADTENVSQNTGKEMQKSAEVRPAPPVAPPPAQPTVAAPAVPVVASPPLVQPKVAPPAAQSVAAQPVIAQPVKTPASEAVIRMTFDADSWVEIKDKNGKILLSQINHPGTELGVNGTPPFSLVIGQSKAVHLYYKGKPVDLAPHTQVAVARLTLE